MPAATMERPKVVIRPSSKEKDSRAHTPAQAPSLITEPENRAEEILPLDRPLVKGEADALAFNEEPIRIIIHMEEDDQASSHSRTTDLVAVNGIKAEVIIGNMWRQVGYLPKGIALYTKRKYVEQLARAKADKVSTRVEYLPDGDRRNHIDRFTKVKHPFSVLEDKNPLGAEWLERLILSR